MATPNQPANDDKIQSQGRKDNAAQPVNATEPNAGAERYPSTSKDDGVEAQPERRSFEGADNPQPRQGAGDGGPDPSVNQGRVDPGGDPAEGKR